MLSKYVGEAERKLSELFATARANAPSIIFMDEVDGLAPVSQGLDGCWLSIVLILMLVVLTDRVTCPKGYGVIQGVKKHCANRIAAPLDGNSS